MRKAQVKQIRNISDQATFFTRSRAPPPWGEALANVQTPVSRRGRRSGWTARSLRTGRSRRAPGPRSAYRRRRRSRCVRGSRSGRRAGPRRVRRRSRRTAAQTTCAAVLVEDLVQLSCAAGDAVLGAARPVDCVNVVVPGDLHVTPEHDIIALVDGSVRQTGLIVIGAVRPSVRSWSCLAAHAVMTPSGFGTKGPTSVTLNGSWSSSVSNRLLMNATASAGVLTMSSAPLSLSTTRHNALIFTTVSDRGRYTRGLVGHAESLGADSNDEVTGPSVGPAGARRRRCPGGRCAT